jgi:hypothetical protein
MIIITLLLPLYYNHYHPHTLRYEIFTRMESI